MPPVTEAEPIDKEAVRTLAVAIGVREAARKLGLDENRVLQWSHRGQWFKQPAKVQQPPTVTKNAVIAVIKPSQALSESLEDDSKATRIGLSQASRRAADHLKAQTGAQVLKSAKSMKEIASVASIVHGWEAKKDAGVQINLNVAIGVVQ